jgi:hypothetical protein
MDGPKIALQPGQKGRDGRFGNGEQAASNAAHAVVLTKAKKSCNDPARVPFEFDRQAVYMNCHKFPIALERHLTAAPIAFSSR